MSKSPPFTLQGDFYVAVNVTQRRTVAVSAAFFEHVLKQSPWASRMSYWLRGVPDSVGFLRMHYSWRNPDGSLTSGEVMTRHASEPNAERFRVLWGTETPKPKKEQPRAYRRTNRRRTDSHRGAPASHDG